MKKIGKIVRYYFTLLQAYIFTYSCTKIRIDEQQAKTLYIDISTTDYHRYLYVLVLFFIRDGYVIVIKPYPKRVARFMLDKYAKKMLHHPSISWGTLPEHKGFTLNENNLNPHYFTDNQSYKIPMCQHPRMYELDIDYTIEHSSRTNALFFAGDFRPHLYETLSKRHFFSHPNRLQTVQIINDSVSNDPNLASKLVIVDNAHQTFANVEYRKQLASYEFFLALPGIHMPLSHNIIEALSLGTIPFIHRDYAALMSPPLIHLQTAYIFSDWNRVHSEIQQLFQLPSPQREGMRKSIETYYRNHLTPASVVNHIIANKSSKFSLIAEWNSIPNV